MLIAIFMLNLPACQHFLRYSNVNITLVLCAYYQDQTDADLDEFNLYFNVAELADIGLLRLGRSEEDSESAMRKSYVHRT